MLFSIVIVSSLLSMSTVRAATGGQFCGINLCVNAVVNGNSVTCEYELRRSVDKRVIAFLNPRDVIGAWQRSTMPRGCDRSLRSQLVSTLPRSVEVPRFAGPSTASRVVLTSVVLAFASDQLVSKFAIDRLGWMAVGFGTKMSNSAIIITWPNADGTVTISQRAATGHIMPTVVANPTNIAALVTENTILSANSTSIAFTYPLPSTAQNAVQMIWAYSNTKPSSNAVDATIVQHDKMGSATMDLTQTVDALSTGTGATTTVIGTSTQTTVSLPTGVSSNGTSSEDGSLTDSEKTIRTHGILMTVGFLVFLPLGIFIARFSRTISFLKAKWFTAHWFVQFIVSGPFIISGWFIGYNYVGEDHFQDSHTRAGLLLLVLYIGQMILGTIIHFFKPKRKPLPPLETWDADEPENSTALRAISERDQTSTTLGSSYPPTLAGPSTTALVNKGGFTSMSRNPTAKDTIMPAVKGRPIQNYAHALLGLFIILLAFYNVHEGYGDEWLGEFGTYVDQVPFLRHMRTWWTASLIVIPLIYIAGLSLLPRQWRQETNARRTLPPTRGFRPMPA